MSRPFKILHAEDNNAEIRLVRQAFDEVGAEVELSVVRNGEEAVDYLLKQNAFSSSRTPDIILLDLNLPKKNGFEVLNFIKTHPRLKSIPVFIFTGSESKDDVARAYDLHANGYIKKPRNFAEYISFFQRLLDFWRHAAVLSEQPVLH